MSGDNGFRGSRLPGGPIVAGNATGSTQNVNAGGPARRAGSTHTALLAEYLAKCGVTDANLIVVNHGTRSETDAALADVLDLLDIAVLRTTHGREPSTFNKELMPGIMMSVTRVQEALSLFGIQTAADALAEGLDTLAPSRLTPPTSPDGTSPMMWVVTEGDVRLAESLYGEIYRTYRPHRHMWSHHQSNGESLRWMILYQLRDTEIADALPGLPHEPAYSDYLQRSDRYLERLQPQTGLTIG